MKMTRKEKREKIASMKALMAEYARRGDVVLRDQMKRTIEDAKAAW